VFAFLENKQITLYLVNDLKAIIYACVEIKAKNQTSDRVESYTLHSYSA